MHKKILDNTNNILIWDEDINPPNVDSKILLWRKFAKSGKDNISIPSLLEGNADQLKIKYLSWIYELGELKINNQSLIDHFKLRDGLGYWWMTVFVEKCNWIKSIHINDALRLMAFEDWVKKQNIDHLVLATSNKNLERCFVIWCETNNVKIRMYRNYKDKPNYLFKKLLSTSLYLFFQSCVWLLVYFFKRYKLKGIGLNQWRSSKSLVTFFSYSDILSSKDAGKGNFKSGYWGNLPEILKKEGCKTNWLHLYVKDPLMPTPKDAASIIDNFNKSKNDMQNHVTLDSFLSLDVFISTLKDWINLIFRAKGFDKKIFLAQRSKLNIWPLFENEWKNSIFGIVAISNILNFNLFEAALKSLPKQRKGFYLQENQGWEFGLIQSWKMMNHGELMGIPHGAMRYWDLRFFFDKRTYDLKGKHIFPKPDKIGVNGKVAKFFFKQNGYPSADLIEVEALRYNYLSEAKYKNKCTGKLKKNTTQLLVLGDYVPYNNKILMNLLEGASLFLPDNLSILIKAHPNCQININDYPTLNITIAKEPVEKLLVKTDVAYASALTSAAVDAYLSGVPIITVVDPNILNLSPLRSCKGAMFASTSEELVSKINLSISNENKLNTESHFFWVDHKLPRWRKILLGY